MLNILYCIFSKKKITEEVLSVNRRYIYIYMDFSEEKRKHGATDDFGEKKNNCLQLLAKNEYWLVPSSKKKSRQLFSEAF